MRVSECGTARLVRPTANVNGYVLSGAQTTRKERHGKLVANPGVRQQARLVGTQVNIAHIWTFHMVRRPRLSHVGRAGTRGSGCGTAQVTLRKTSVANYVLGGVLLPPKKGPSVKPKRKSEETPCRPIGLMQQVLQLPKPQWPSNPKTNQPVPLQPWLTGESSPSNSGTAPVYAVVAGRCPGVYHSFRAAQAAIRDGGGHLSSHSSVTHAWRHIAQSNDGAEGRRRDAVFAVSGGSHPGVYSSFTQAQRAVKLGGGELASFARRS